MEAAPAQFLWLEEVFLNLIWTGGLAREFPYTFFFISDFCSSAYWEFANKVLCYRLCNDLHMQGGLVSISVISRWGIYFMQNPKEANIYDCARCFSYLIFCAPPPPLRVARWCSRAIRARSMKLAPARDLALPVQSTRAPKSSALRRWVQNHFLPVYFEFTLVLPWFYLVVSMGIWSVKLKETRKIYIQLLIIS